MDNEACSLLNDTIINKNIPYQLVTQYIHLWDAIKISTRTFKEQFIAGLC